MTRVRFVPIVLFAAAALCVGVPVASNDAHAQGIPVPKAGDADDKPEMKKGDGWLGVSLTTIPKEKASERGFAQDLVAVDNVFNNSPAHSSGFEEGDVILAYNGEKIAEVKQLVNLVRGTDPGSKVTFEVLRGKEKMTVPLLLGLRPDRLGMIKDHFLGKKAPELKATWCGPCRRSIPELNAMVKRHKGQDFVLLGISDEDKGVLSKFLEKNDLAYPTATDADRATNKNFMVSVLPTTFIIDQDGVIRDVFVGADGMKDLAAKVGELLGKPL